MNMTTSTIPQVKICGITNESDAISAVQAGANFLGYIMNYPDSPRYMRPDQVKKIIAIVRRLYPAVQHVGVFVDATSETVQAITADVGFDVVQLHGAETPQAIAQIRLHHSPQPKIWKVFELQSVADADGIKQYEDLVDMVMVDAGKGAGVLIDDTLLQAVELPTEFILAGGLKPDNIAQRVEQLQPAIIDISSGVEALPGKKDPQKLQQLFNALQQ